ncbi:tetratricopeptide repeat protein [Hyphomicrobium sp.]|uniref:tetratricopeptide repeat protein n=1 Tax=Hyphomicrobium sp. TaxID=82 RepID=UPI000F92C0F7|nr:tetratricopeptide repeat protein [Hyphomicrobium sp.]RUP00313.1 MAG: tetratricopeptide repeat protein [Hyphomicrobium sp.]
MNQQWPSLADLPDAEDPAADKAAEFDAEAASAVDLLLVGLQIARSGEFDVAAEAFAKAIVKDPELAEAYEALATVLVPLNKIEFAIGAKSKAISLGYNSAESWGTLGDMLASVGRYDEAVDAFRTALNLDSSVADLRGKLEMAEARSTRPLSQSMAAAQPANDDADLFGADFLNEDADAIGEAWRQVNLVTIEPEGNVHKAAFDDLASGFEHALRSLGANVRRQSNKLENAGVNLVLGAHLVPTQEMADRIPQNTVIINLEQITGFNVRERPIYLSLLKRLAVWDYSVRNIVELRRMTQNKYIRHVSVGYTPEMTRARPSQSQPVDVLFYGSTNTRRLAILRELERAGLNVNHLFSVYGEKRDRAIAEAKIVLNMHFYEDSIHEIIRTSYLLANSKAIVSECGPRTEIDDDIRRAMVAVPYENLVASCVALVRDEPRRRALERTAFEIFSKRDQAKILRETIAATELAPLAS